MTPLTEGMHKIDAETYHSDPCATPSYSNSIGTTLIQQSPLHAWTEHPRLNPHYQPRVDSKFDVGTAAHDLLLCRTSAKICVVDADNWMTKAAKTARDEARANGLVPLLRKHDYAVRKMVEKATKKIEASEWRDVFKAGDPELVAIWRENGVLCRSRLDWLTACRTIIFDYKTTENAAPEAWIRGHFAQMGYDMQAELYGRAVRQLCESDPIFVFGVQEVSPPYEMSFVVMSEPSRQIAEAKNNFALHLWNKCLTANKWPGYSNATAMAEPKPWDLQELSMGRWAPDADRPEKAAMSDEECELSMFTAGGRSAALRGGK